MPYGVPADFFLADIDKEICIYRGKQNLETPTILLPSLYLKALTNVQLPELVIQVRDCSFYIEN